MNKNIVFWVFIGFLKLGILNIAIAEPFGFYVDRTNLESPSVVIDAVQKETHELEIYPSFSSDLKALNIDYVNDFFNCASSSAITLCVSNDSPNFEPLIDTIRYVNKIEKINVKSIAYWDDLVAFNIKVTLENDKQLSDVIVFDCSNKCIYTNVFGKTGFFNNGLSVEDIFISVFNAKNYGEKVPKKKLSSLTKLTLFNSEASKNINELNVYFRLAENFDQDKYKELIDGLMGEVDACALNLCELIDVMKKYFGGEYKVYAFPLTVIQNDLVQGAGFIGVDQLFYLLNQWDVCRPISGVYIERVTRVFFNCKGKNIEHIVALPFSEFGIMKDFVELPVDKVFGTLGFSNYLKNYLYDENEISGFKNNKIEGAAYSIVKGELGEAIVPKYNIVDPSETMVKKENDFVIIIILSMILILCCLFAILFFLKKRK